MKNIRKEVVLLIVLSVAIGVHLNVELLSARYLYFKSFLVGERDINFQGTVFNTPDQWWIHSISREEVVYGTVTFIKGKEPLFLALRKQSTKIMNNFVKNFTADRGGLISIRKTSDKEGYSVHYWLHPESNYVVIGYKISDLEIEISEQFVASIFLENKSGI